MSRRSVIVCACLCLVYTTWAETTITRSYQQNSLSLSWGDPITQTAAFHESVRRDYTLFPAAYKDTENRNYKYVGHLTLAYQRRHNDWFGYGIKADISAFTWDRYTFQGGSNDWVSIAPQHCYNLSFIPELYFTWYHHEWIDLYTSFGIGFDINGGTETNFNGHQTEAGLAMDIALVGLIIGRRHFFGLFEIGGMTAFKDLDHIYLLNSRFLSAGIGVRF